MSHCRSVSIIFLSLIVSITYALETREVLLGYFNSDKYVQMIKPLILPHACLDILKVQFSGLYEDSVFEDALIGANCDRPLLDHPDASSALLVNDERVSKTIPLDDFIASPKVLRLIEQILESVAAIEPPMKPIAPSLWFYHGPNWAAYNLMTELSFKSECDHIDCRVFRKIVEQTHYQLTVIIKTRRSVRSRDDLFEPIDSLYNVVSALSRAVDDSLTPTTPPPRQSGFCRFWCFRQRTTTTPFPLFEVRPQFIELAERKTIAHFKRKADEKLDQALIYIGKIMVNPEPNLFSSITNPIPQLVDLTNCAIMFFQTHEDAKSALLKLVHSLLRHSMDSVIGEGEWHEIFTITREIVHMIRSSLAYL